MKDAFIYKVQAGKIHGKRPTHEKTGKRGRPSGTAVLQEGDIRIEACMTCPYKDCKYAILSQCPHYTRVVYGK